MSDMRMKQPTVTFDECVRVLAYFCIQHEIVVTRTTLSVRVNGTTFSEEPRPAEMSNVVPFIILDGIL